MMTKLKTIKKTSLKTPLGIAEITGSAEGITGIRITDVPAQSSGEIPAELQNAADQLQDYFSGNLKTFNLKLDPEGTPFQKRVWKALLEIPYGTTVSYLQLSKQLGDLKAIRAVASANGKNPLWIVIPCHRVIGSDGSLTGYAGGLQRKKWLLDHESPAIQQSLF